MSGRKLIEFDYQEIASALVRASEVNEGHWGIAITFGIQGANIKTEPQGDLVPAAIVPILKLGLQKFDSPNSMTVDASKINKKTVMKESSKKAAKKRSS